MMFNIRIFVLVLAAVNGLGGKTVDLMKYQKRGLYFGHMISCETGRSFFDYLNYGCFCGLGGAGTPVDDLDTCCFKHDKCYDDLHTKKICHLKTSVYLITYKYSGCSTCSKPSEYSWWDSFGLESSECRHALCECDAVAARCFRKAGFNDRFNNYDQAKCNHN